MVELLVWVLWSPEVFIMTSFSSSMLFLLVVEWEASVSSGRWIWVSALCHSWLLSELKSVLLVHLCWGGHYLPVLESCSLFGRAVFPSIRWRSQNWNFCHNLFLMKLNSKKALGSLTLWIHLLFTSCANNGLIGVEVLIWVSPHFLLDGLEALMTNINSRNAL